MHDSQEHVFTNEFDDMWIAISLNLDTAPTSMQITISDPELNRETGMLFEVLLDQCF